ncbi:MAG: MmcB family DNA repair protein [Pseudomonadota bacterium]|nr:MmcB family DNA repair protein [Pseudomonadota bacterium]
MSSPTFSPLPRETTHILTRGVCRLFQHLGFGTLTEFRLSNGRRVDVMAMNPSGEFVIVEIKSTVADYRADKKWHQYLPFCEQFYFAIPSGFPIKLVPSECGVIMADSFDAVVRRESFSKVLSPKRKRHQLINFALTASSRLGRFETR